MWIQVRIRREKKVNTYTEQQQQQQQKEGNKTNLKDRLMDGTEEGRKEKKYTGKKSETIDF